MSQAQGALRGVWFCDAVVEASSYLAGSLNLQPHPHSPAQAAEEALEADSRRFAQHLQEDAAATKAALAAVAEASDRHQVLGLGTLLEGGLFLFVKLWCSIGCRALMTLVSQAG